MSRPADPAARTPDATASRACAGLHGALRWTATAALAACVQPAPAVPRLPAAEVPADLGARALAHTAAVVAMGERRAGTPGWQAQLDHIAAALRRCGLEPRIDRWTDAREGLTFANVMATLPGRSAERVVLACHHDTKCCAGHADPARNFPFVGANDGGSGVGLLLALAETLAAGGQRAATLEFVFFDGEESVDFDWNEARALFGSRRYVAAEVAPGGRHWLAPIRAMLLLDMVGARDLQIDDDQNSDPVLKRIVRAAAASCGESARFFVRRNHVSDDHLPFARAGIPAAVLIDLADNPQWHTPQDTLDHLSADSLHAVGRVVLTALPEIERRFLSPARRGR